MHSVRVRLVTRRVNFNVQRISLADRSVVTTAVLGALHCKMLILSILLMGVAYTGIVFLGFLGLGPCGSRSILLLPVIAVYRLVAAAAFAAVSAASAAASGPAELLPQFAILMWESCRFDS